MVSLYFHWRLRGCKRRDPDIPPHAFFGIPPPPSSTHQLLHPSDHQNWSSENSQGPHLSMASAVSGRGCFWSFLTDRKCKFFFFRWLHLTPGPPWKDDRQGCPQLKKKRAVGDSIALSETPWKKREGGKKGRNCKVGPPWEVVTFPIFAVSDSLPGYFALKVLRQEKGWVLKCLKGAFKPRAFNEGRKNGRGGGKKVGKWIR